MASSAALLCRAANRLQPQSTAVVGVFVRDVLGGFFCTWAAPDKAGLAACFETLAVASATSTGGRSSWILDHID